MLKPLILLVLTAIARGASAEETKLTPMLDGEPWTIATNPNLGDIDGGQKQQPVDFAIWQAADGSWQVWSCIRNTNCGGKTRLFHRWEGAKLTDRDWKPMGIAMRADPKVGEQEGGLQAPHVFKLGEEYRMVYGGWTGIFLAKSRDGKTFERILTEKGNGQLFTEDRPEVPANTRDPMMLRIGQTWYCYYTAHANREGIAYCRTSQDLKTWSESKKVAQGGKAGNGPYSAECPFVVQRQGAFYLFRTQKYGANAETRVYRSADPLNFGIDNDSGLVATLKVAAPEIVFHEDQEYIAYLLPSLKGICVQKLKWRKTE